MRLVSSLFIVLAGSLLMAEGESRSGSNHPVVAEFQARVQRYMEVRKEAAKTAPDLKKKADPATVIAREQALGAAIRKARSSAQAGDVITPAARKYFQSLTMAQVRAPGGAAVKDTIKQGNPPADKEGADVKLEVNGLYPKAAPKSTMPASLLGRLPKLPEELEYRFIGRTLILLDSEANVIVDYAPQVGPSL